MMTPKEFFQANKKVALAFSGGVDSAYLLYLAKFYNADVTAYFVKSQFQPEFEYQDALRLSKELGASLKVLHVDVLENSDVRKNPDNRCYYCKKTIFSRICEEAKKDGYDVIMDGTNASDDLSERPGAKALQEMQVLSPLRLCNLTKDDIRKKSKEANLFTWDKPAYACLATRIKPKEMITETALKKVELAEGILFSLGFSDFRVRVSKNRASIVLREEEVSLYHRFEEKITEEFLNLFDEVELSPIRRG